MADLTPLLNKGATDFETDLLAAGRRRAVSGPELARAAARIGAAATLVAAGSVIGGGAASGAAALKVTSALGLTSGKLLVTMITVGLVTGAALVSRRPSRAPDETRTPAITRARSPLIEPVAAVARKAANSAPLLRGQPREQPRERPRGVARATARARAESPEPTLSREVARLDEVRRLLERKEAARAKSVLATYRREFPLGLMAAEATVLQVETLLLAGDRAAAGQLAAHFQARHPHSPYAERLASLLDPRLRPPSR